ncbi:MAG: putative Ig domain-containing protein [Luteolibacter sp.]
MPPSRLVSRFQTLTTPVWLGVLVVAMAQMAAAAAPTAILLNPHTLMENCLPGTVVGTLTSVDADAGDSHTFEFVSGTGATDNAGFSISGNQLIAPYGISIQGVNIDFETSPVVFSIRVKTKDSTQNSYEQVLLIQMTDDRTEDVDGDGLTEADEEDLYGTSDLSYDSDLDGICDGIEVMEGTSPANANDWPDYPLIGWGDNQLGEIHGLVDDHTVSISTGQNHSLALASDGTVTAWAGLNFYGQTTVPAGLGNVVAVAAGGDFWEKDSAFSLALRSNGTVAAWGCDTDGQTEIPVGLSGVTAISAGRVHCLALKNDGTVVTWGFGPQGELAVPDGLANVIAISAGGYHSLALKSDGTVVAWGNIFNGESWQPVTVPIGLCDVVSISAGRFHSLALRRDGTVVAWGYNLHGETDVPANLTGVVAVAAGGFHSLALKNDGSVVAWGFNDRGQSTTPPSAHDHVKQISAGIFHSLALRQVAGFPEITSIAQISAPPGAPVSYQITVANAIPAGFSASGLPAGLVLNPVTGLITGTVGAAARKSVRIQVGTDKGVVTQVLWIGIYSGLPPTDIDLSPPAVMENSPDGSVVGALSALDPDQGDTHTYELVDGTGSADNVHFRISGNQLLVNQGLDRDFEKNSASFSIRVRARDASLNPFEKIISVAILDDRTEDADGDGLSEADEEDLYGTSDLVYDTDGDGFGDGYEVLHGTSLTNAASQPTGTLLVAWGNNEKGQTIEPSGLGDVVNLAAGWQHSLALRTDRTVIAWGRNDEGQTAVPAGLSDVVQIAAGDIHSMALRSDGTVAAWGGNTEGQTTLPQGLADVIAISAGSCHSLALKRDGTVVAWGLNQSGQTSVPAGLTGVVAIAAGGFHSLALKSDGTVVAWGSNWGGAATIPEDLQRVVAIAAGAYHNLALKNDGTVVVWGDSSSGQGFPAEGLKDVDQIAVGWIHSAVLKNDGTVVAWGMNNHGQTTAPLEARQIKLLASGDFHNLALRKSTGFTEITNRANVLAWPGNVVSCQIQVAGAVPSHFEAVGLPADLTINPATGLISGTIVNGERRSVNVLVDTDKGRLSRILWFDTVDGKPPTGMTLNSTPMMENSPSGTVAGTLSAIDPDVGDVHTFSLIADNGSLDNRYFLIAGNQLVIRPGFDRDFETNPENLSIRVMVSDSALNTYIQVFSIPFLDDRTEDADGDGVSEAREEDVFHSSDSIFGDYATAAGDADFDGISPLIEYAFNLNPQVPDGNVHLGGADSTVGLPTISLVSDGQGHRLLRIEYLRRIGSGLTYTPQFSSGLSPSDWQPATQPVQVTPINGSWERCAVDDSQVTPGVAKRFGRVAVAP